MNVSGQRAGPNTSVYQVQRPGKPALALHVCAMPLGFPERMDRELPDPPPPVEFARGDRNEILRGDDGRALTVANDRDPAWLAERERVRALKQFWVLHQGLTGDPSVHFDSDRAKFKTARAWLESIEKEVEHFGLGNGEVVAICGLIWRLGAGFVRAVEEGTEDFLPEPPAPESVSPTTPADPRRT